MRKTFTLLIALLALSLTAWAQSPTVITWDASDLATVNLTMGHTESQEIDHITVTLGYQDAVNDYCHFFYQGAPYNHCAFSMRDNGSLTFVPESGLLTSIVITCDLLPSDMTLPSGWKWVSEHSQLKWTGSAASVQLMGDGSSTNLTSGQISSIVFTVSGFVPTTTWAGNDLTSVNVEMENGVVAQGANQSQTVNDITITANAPTNVTEDDYNYSYFGTYFDEYDSNNNSTNLSVSGEGSLTFAPASGKLKKIVITCGTAMDANHINNENDEWNWDPNTSKLTWTGDATSVVMTPADPGTGFGFMNISSVVFTVTSEEPSVDPTPSGASIIWEQRQVSHVNFTYNATSPVIKNIILSLTETSNSGYYSFSDSQLLIQNNADLKFKSIVGNLTGIVITCSSADHHADLPTSWEYDAVAQTFTWAGDAEEVTLTGDIYATISSIEFTYTPAEAPRLGEAFWDGLGQKYVITGAHTAKVPQQTIYGTLDIPASVIDQDVIYYITEIADNAFKDNDHLSNAYIGENIARIGAHAFDGCLRMYEAQTNSYVVDEIGDEAFKDCKLMYAFSCYTYTPPVLGTNAFSGDGLLNHINVYYDALPDYRIATNWSSYNSKISVLGSDAAVGDVFFYLDQMTQNIYAVTSTSPKEAKVMPYTSDIKAIYPVSREGSLIIPEKAYYMGSEYAITGIGANAYTGETGITMVIMPQNVKTIEAGAFLGCTNVEKVYFLWDDLSGITWADGAEGKGNEFDADTKIFVPKGMLATYQAWAPAWASRMVGGDVLDVEAAAPDPEDTEHFGQYYRTFYDGSSDYMMPAGVWAYAGYVRNNEFILRPIAFDGQTLPRRTAVVLGSQTAEYRLIPMGNDAPLYTGQNELRGTDEDLAVSSLPVADQDKVYVLGKEAWIGENRQPGMGMYKYTGSTLGAHKAYLIYNGTGSGSSNQQNAPIRFLFNREEQATGFENVQEGNSSCSKILRDGQLIIIKDNKEYNAQGLIIK